MKTDCRTITTKKIILTFFYNFHSGYSFLFAYLIAILKNEGIFVWDNLINDVLIQRAIPFSFINSIGFVFFLLYQKKISKQKSNSES